MQTSEIRKLRKLLDDATKRAEKAMERRKNLPAGSTRAKITTANANWMSACENRDRIAEMLRKAELNLEEANV